MCCSKEQNNAQPASCKRDNILTANEGLARVGKEQQKLDSGQEKPAKIDEDFYIKMDTEIYLFHNKKNDQIYAIELGPDDLNSAWLFEPSRYPEVFVPGYKGYEIAGIFAGVFGEYKVEDPQYFFKKKLEYGGAIDSKYFTTKLGVKLGMSSSEVVKIYGPPASIEVVSNDPKISRYKWQIYGEDEAKLYSTIDKKKVCPGEDFGVDYEVDFVKNKETDRAIIIYIWDHIP